MAYTVILEGGAPWGFRLQGGREFNEAIKIAKINPNSKAYNQGIQAGDFVDQINSHSTVGLMHNEALQLIKNANNRVVLELRRDSKPSTPVFNGPVNGDINSNSPYINGDGGTSRFTIPSIIVNHHSDEHYTSSSESQSSVINAHEPFKPNTNCVTSTSTTTASNNFNNNTTTTKMEDKPSTSVWSPFGENQTKSYKPVSFNINKKTTPSQPVTKFSPSSPTKISSPPSTFSSTSITTPMESQDKQPESKQDMNSIKRNIIQGYEAKHRDSPSGLKSPPPQTTSQGWSNSFGSPPAQGNWRPSSPTKPGGASGPPGKKVWTPSSLPNSPAVGRAPWKSNSQPDGLPGASYQQKKQWQPPAGSRYGSPKKWESPTTPSSDPTRVMSPTFAKKQWEPPVPVTSHTGPKKPWESEPRPGSPVKRPVSPQKSHQSQRPTTPVKRPGSPQKPYQSSTNVNASSPSTQDWRPQTPTQRSGGVSPSPGSKSKGMEIFLRQQEKHRKEDDDEIYYSSTDEFDQLGSSPPKSTPTYGYSSQEQAHSPQNEPMSNAQLFDRRSPSPIRYSPNPSAKKVDSKTEKKPEVLKNGFDSTTTSSVTPSSVISSNHGTDSSITSSSITSKFNGGSPKPGIWTPGSQPISIEKDLKDREDEKLKDREQEKALKEMPHVWTPGGSDMFKKEYKPVSVKLDTKKSEESRISDTIYIPEESFAWSPPENTTASDTVPTATTTTATTSFSSSTTPSFSTWNGTISHFSETKSGLPQTQSPAITLLKKTREGQIPKGAIYVGEKETVEGDKKHTDSFYYLPGEEKKTVTQTVTEKKAPNYAGIGPTDEEGTPIGLRQHVDEKKQKDWYKKMYKSLHATDKPEETNTYKPTYVFPEDESEPEKEGSKGSTVSLDRYTTGSLGKKGNWSPPHAKYRDGKYKNQPRSIIDYEPGYSSIAFKEANSSNLYNPPIEKPGQYSKYTVKDYSSDLDIRKKERSVSPSVEGKGLYKSIQKGGDIPYYGLGYPAPEKREDEYDNSPLSSPTRIQRLLSGEITPKSPSLSAAVRLGVKSPTKVTNDSFEERQWQNKPKHHSASASDLPSHRSPSSTLDRRRRDEENARRKEKMEKYYAEEKKRKMEEEMAANEARRHSDFWSPHQKSPIPLDRYNDDSGIDVNGLQRPKKKVNTKVRGKAKALYTFRAQNSKELSFRKGDVVYVLNQVDQNWYEGEHHGRVGIFPANYVEMITSLEDARAIALQREGNAFAKYNFNAQTSMELTLRKGESVHLIRRVDDNWYEGRVGNRQGIFPVAYVEVHMEPDTPLMTPMSSLAPTPLRGSPSQLSPVSTVSTNGPAPTIPEAPLSPRDFDQFDLQNQYMGEMYGPSSASSVASSAYSSNQKLGSPAMAQQRIPSASRNPYGTLDAHGSAGPYGTRDKSGSASSPLMYRDGYGTMDKYRDGPSAAGAQTSPYGSKENYSVKKEEPKYPAYRAVYTYVPQNEDELELREGDVVYVMEKCDDGWFVGTSDRTKEFGTFPGNYVTLL